MRSHKLSYGAVSLLLSCLPALAKQYDASHYDVSLAVSPGGTLHVTQSVDFRFGHGPFTFVYRNLATTETDGIGEIKAWLDGVECPMGGAPGQVEVRGSSPVRVTWHFNPVQDRDSLVHRQLPGDRRHTQAGRCGCPGVASLAAGSGVPDRVQPHQARIPEAAGLAPSALGSEGR